jgi:hypothetical protein
MSSVADTVVVPFTQAMLPMGAPPAPLAPPPKAETALQPVAVGPNPLDTAPSAAPAARWRPASTAAQQDEAQPSVPPPPQPGASLPDDADDPLSAAAAALPALNTAGFASPPPEGQQLPAATAETPTNAMIDSWLADTPTQPQRASQGGFSLPPPSQPDF